MPQIVQGGKLGSFAVTKNDDSVEISSLQTYETITLTNINRPLVLVSHFLDTIVTWQVMGRRGAPLGCHLVYHDANGSPIYTDCILAEFGAGHNHQLSKISVSYAVATPAHGCSEDMLRDHIVGRILIVERGHCAFEEKALVAQKLGADAIVVINNDATGIFIMSGQSELDQKTFSFRGVSIPCVMVPQAFGNQLVAHLVAHPGDAGELSFGILRNHIDGDTSLDRSRLPIIPGVGGNQIQILGRKQWGLQLEKDSSSGLWKVLIIGVEKNEDGMYVCM